MRNFASDKTRSLFSAALSAPQTPRRPAVEKSRAAIRESWDAVRVLQGELRKALVDGDRVECDNCPELKALVDEVEAFAKAKYPKASKAVRACVARKIPKLIDEGKPQDQAIAIAFSMCGESAEKALSEEGADQDEARMREAAEAAEAGAELDDFTEHAINIVAEAIMRAKKGQKLNMTPEQASARAKKAWESRKKKMQAKPEESAPPAAPAAEEEPAAAPAPAAEPEGSAGVSPTAEEPPPVAPPTAPPSEPAAAESQPTPPEPAAAGGAVGQAQSQASSAGQAAASGDLSAAASAASGLMQTLQDAHREAEESGDAEAASGIQSLMDEIQGVPEGLKTLAAQGGVDEAVRGQIKQTFDDIGERLTALSGGGAAPASEPPAGESAPAPEPAPEPVAPSEPGPSVGAPSSAPESATVKPEAEAPAVEAPVSVEAPAAGEGVPSDGEAGPKAGGWKKAKVSQKAVSKVQGVMSRNGFKNESEEMEELAYFKGTLGDRGRGRTVDQLKRDFIENMNPGNYASAEAFQQAKARMQKTPAKDFAMILAAIHEDEEVPAPAGASPAPVAASLGAYGAYRDDAARIVRGALDRVLEGAGE